MLANEVFPRRLVACRTAAGEREVFEMQRIELRAAFGASLQRFSKPFDRHTPALGACPAIKALDERRVDRQSSHSTPCALIGDDAQQHADGQRKQRAATWPPIAVSTVAPVMITISPLAASGVRRGRIRSAHGRMRPTAPQTSATPMKRRNGPGSATGPCCMASTGRTSFIPPAKTNNAASSPWMVHSNRVGSHRDISFCSPGRTAGVVFDRADLQVGPATGRRGCRFRPTPFD